MKDILIGISNRHVHLCKEDLEKLFGKNYKLKVLKNIRQPGQFAAEETVEIINKGKLFARVVGPIRNHTQVEILSIDQEILGLNPPIRMSGDTKNTPGIKIKGPKDIIELNEGVIIAEKHLHLSKEESENLKLKTGSKIMLKHANGTEFEVQIRSGEGHLSEFHLNKDEALSLNIKNKDIIQIV
jgi:putative phosphotransacetylase